MKKRYALLFVFLIVCWVGSVAQKTTDRVHTLSFLAGYSNILEGTSGLTRQIHSYERELSEGVSWDVGYYFHPIKIMGIGILYSGFSSKGSHEEGSDHVHTHYIAPQVGLYCYENRYFFIRLSIGAGSMIYRNDSKVFGKSRLVRGSSAACNAGVNATLKLTRHWNLEANVQYIHAHIKEVTSLYHGKEITVEFNDDPLSVSRLNLSAGISYSF